MFAGINQVVSRFLHPCAGFPIAIAIHPGQAKLAFLSVSYGEMERKWRLSYALSKIAKITEHIFILSTHVPTIYVREDVHRQDGERLSDFQTGNAFHPASVLLYAPNICKFNSKSKDSPVAEPQPIVEGNTSHLLAPAYLSF